MEGENVTFIVPSCSSIPTPDVPVTPQIVEEGPRVCPLCSAEVRLFYINFNDKMLMCENTQCEFPFGYEELQFVRVDGAEHTDMVSVRTKHTSVAGSVISTSAWSEIDKINKVFDSEDSQNETPESNAYNKPKNVLNKDNIDQIQKNVNDIKGLNMELVELSKQKGIIKNEKWIKKLKSLSGNQYLKPQELDQLKKKKYKLDNKELKINILPGSDPNTISSIKIDITDKNE